MPFVHYVGNKPSSAAAQHFHGLREALPELKGIVLLDRLEGCTPDDPILGYMVWRMLEIENYLCNEATLEAYARASARADQPLPLFASSEVDNRPGAMRESILEVCRTLDMLGKGSPWDADLKVSGEFLRPLFTSYFKKIGMSNLMSKKNFYELTDCVSE